MLASTVEDVAEAESCYLTADSLWRMVRRNNPAVDDGEVDRPLNEIRIELDDLKNALDRWGDEGLTEEDQADGDEEERAAAGGHDDDAIYLDLRDEATALGVVTDDMRKAILKQGDGEAYSAGTIHGR